MHATRKNTQVLIGPVLDEGRFKSIKIYTLSYLLTHGKFKNLYFIAGAGMVCVSHVFVYNAVDINKIVTVSSTKLSSYTYAQVTAGLKLYLG